MPPPPCHSAPPPHDAGVIRRILSPRAWISERAGVIAVLLLASFCYWKVAEEWEKDAGKASQGIEEAHQAEKFAKVREYAAVGMHRAALANASVCLLLALATPLWHRSRPKPRSGGEEGAAPSPEDKGVGGSSLPAPATGGRARWVLALAAIAVIAGAVRVPLSLGGFWHDEALQMQRVNGYYRLDRLDDDGVPKFRPARWVETWFHYRKPTNHTAVGVPARACLEAWRSATGAPREAFAEWVVRLPSLFASMGAVVFVALTARRWGLPRAGLLAALLLAIHPWHMRWGVDLRAYSLGVFSIALALWSLTRSLQTGRWLDWAVFGLAQFLLLWTSILHLWLAGAFALAAALVLWRRHGWREATPFLGRLMAVNVVAATLFFQAMTPNLMQFVQASNLRDPSEEVFMKLNKATGMDSASNLFLGIPHHVPVREGDEPITTWETRFEGVPLAGWAFFGSHLILLLGGFLVVRRRPPAGTLVAAVTLALALHLASTGLFNLYFYPRFVTYLLPVVVLLTAAAWAVGLPRTRWLAWVGACGFFLATAWPQFLNILRREHEPFRPIMAAVDEVRAQTPGGDVVAACYGLAGDILQEIYDPRIRFITKAGEIRALEKEAREMQAPLLIAYGNQSFNRATLPDGFKLLDDPDRFTLIDRFVANDPRHTFFLMRGTNTPGEPAAATSGN